MEGMSRLDVRKLMERYIDGSELRYVLRDLRRRPEYKLSFSPSILVLRYAAYFPRRRSCGPAHRTEK